MSYNVKNYTEQGGETTVIGGTLEIKEGASITGLPQAENQADSTASTVADLKSAKFFTVISLTIMIRHLP